ncbi:MAG: ribosome biogenesis GTPase Der [Phycisphaerae bacterium]
MTMAGVAIVGRPNVGKSSLFNLLAGRRISIVDPTAGVTRDRITTTISHGEGVFELIDTGGHGVEDRDNLTDEIESQIRAAVDQAALLLLVVDAKTGVTPLDRTVAKFIRRFAKPVLLVINKVDGAGQAQAENEFFSLGFPDAVCVSCTHHRGRGELLDAIAGRIDLMPAAGIDQPVLKLAVVGKRNAGKSTLINTLAGCNRVIVSDVPGTTRDSVDVSIRMEDKTFLMIDTAGVRRRSKMTSDDLEFYSYHRAQRSIRRADVSLMLLDASLEAGDVDQKLARYIAENFKPVIFVVNKWDMVKGRASPADFGQYLGTLFPQLAFAPISCISALNNDNVLETLQLAMNLYQQSGIRLPTAQLNSVVEEIVALRGPGSHHGRRIKVYYATQIDAHPPTIVLFVNHPDAVDEEYERFFVRELRLRTVLREVPIRLLLRGHRTRRAQGDSA